MGRCPGASTRIFLFPTPSLCSPRSGSATAKRKTAPRTPAPKTRDRDPCNAFNGVGSAWTDHACVQPFVGYASTKLPDAAHRRALRRPAARTARHDPARPRSDERRTTLLHCRGGERKLLLFLFLIHGTTTWRDRPPCSTGYNPPPRPRSSPRRPSRPRAACGPCCRCSDRMSSGPTVLGSDAASMGSRSSTLSSASLLYHA